WAVEFNDWMLKGFELYRGRLAGAGQATARLPISGCAIRLPKSGMTVFTSILDFGGDMRGRPFPICFYAAVPTPQWPGPTSDHLVDASRAIRDLSALRREVPRFLNSPGRFESVFGNREVDLTDIVEETSDTSWMEAAKTVALADWFEGAKSGMKVKETGIWLRLASAWGDNLAKHESKTFEPTLRFPLAMRLPLDAQIAGWFRWLESRMDLKRRWLSMVVSGEPGDEPGHLTVIAREVVADDFLLLTPFANTLGYLDDLSQLEEASGMAEAAFEPPSVEAASTGSWIDFVGSAVTLT
ncbi:MAG: hypothetical protein WBE26_12655, partial [Phycisphaerae bacterium]